MLHTQSTAAKTAATHLRCTETKHHNALMKHHEIEIDVLQRTILCIHMHPASSCISPPCPAFFGVQLLAAWAQAGSVRLDPACLSAFFPPALTVNPEPSHHVRFKRFVGNLFSCLLFPVFILRVQCLLALATHHLHGEELDKKKLQSAMNFDIL